MSGGRDKKRIAVFASGNGSNLQALIDACRAGTIKGDIVAVVSNKKYAYALSRAREAGIETFVFDPADYKSKTLWCSKMTQALQDRRVDLVCLAGFMLKLDPSILRAFPNKILNIHPALLPKYGGKGMYGAKVHEAVLAAGETESGCTIHMVDELYDHGPIIAQAKVPVEPGESPQSLAQKIHAKEHELYVNVVRDICDGKIELKKGNV